MVPVTGRLLYDFGGLVTAPGVYSRQAASCVKLDNFNIPAQGVLRKRLGFAKSAGTSATNANFLGLFNTKTLGKYLIGYDEGNNVGTWQDVWLGDLTNAWTWLGQGRRYGGSNGWTFPRCVAMGPGHSLLGSVGVGPNQGCVTRA